MRQGDVIWELPTTRYVESMLNEHGMQNAKSVVTPALSRNDDNDEGDEEASVEEHRILRRIVGKMSVPGSTQTRHCIRHEPFGEVSGETFKVRHHCVETSFEVSVRYNGFWFEAAGAEQNLFNADSVRRQRLGRRQTHTQVCVFVGDHAGWVLAQRRVHEHSPWLLNHHVKLSTSPPQQPRVKRSTSKVCS